ncbi:MAG: hypothetical protein LKM35_08500 [Lachnospiraceae bacterium]|jgi:uncharacterized membrane protein|nr:hypothetical protein [Lachnospiraceae bacterium]
MQSVSEQIKAVPDYIKWGFTHQTLIAVIVLAVFIFVLFFSNKVAGILRTLFVIVCIAACAYGAIAKKFDIVWTAFLALVILAIVRLIAYIIHTIRQNRINARIEERALAKAAQRRGSWKNKQGYSGEAKPIVDDYKPGKMSDDEIKDVIENEKADLPRSGAAAAAAAAADQTASDASAEAAKTVSDASADAAKTVSDASADAAKTVSDASADAAKTVSDASADAAKTVSDASADAAKSRRKHSGKSCRRSR